MERAPRRATVMPAANAPHLRWFALAVIFAVALAARLVYLHVAQDAELFNGLFLDSRWYADQAAAIRLGDGIGAHPYLMSPLYPYFLALFTDARGVLDVDAVRTCQAVAGALTAVITAAIAARISGRSTGWIAGLVAALYGPLIHIQATILVPALQGLFITAGIWFALVARDSTRRAMSWWLGAGLAFGLASTLHATSLAVAAGVALAYAWSERRAWRTLVSRLGALALGLVVVIAPFTIRNSTQGGETILLSANSGFNFWIGNHAGATGLFRAPEGYDFRNDPVGRALAAKSLGHKPSYAESSRHWEARAFADIERDPAHWIGLLVRKAAYCAHPREIQQLGESFDWYRDRAWPLRFPLDARMLILLALAAPFAFFCAQRRSADLALILAASGAYALAIVLFFVTARYRAPIMPLVIAAASVGTLETIRLVATGRATRAWSIVMALVLAFAFTQWLYSGPLAVRSTTSVEERHQGMTLYDAGRYAEAVECYERALDMEDDAITRANLANALKALNRIDEARAQYELVLARNPRDGVTWYNYGNLLRSKVHDARAALEAYRKATEFAPQMGEAHFNLGAVLMELGDYDTAIVAIQAALQVAPPNAPWRKDADNALSLAHLRAAEKKGVLGPPRKE